MRKDTYTGGEHYWIQFENGIHVVKRETPDFEPENEVVFKGHYEKCVKFINDLVIANADYDLNI